VHAAVERVGGDHQLLVGARLQQRGVVTDAEQDVVALEGTGADAFDEGEFGQGHGAFYFHVEPSHARLQFDHAPHCRTQPCAAR